MVSPSAEMARDRRQRISPDPEARDYLGVDTIERVEDVAADEAHGI